MSDLPPPYEPSIAYGRLMHEAVCGVIRKVLQDVSEQGLPGEHHFFITFDTRHSGVEMADWLKERYDEEMMVVIQNWYDNLVVSEAGFAITLNFGDAPERLNIPFDSILTFVDPSVEFGWRFERTEDEDDATGGNDDGGDDTPPSGPAPDKGDAGESDTPRDAEVVSLDTFRRKQ